MFDPFRDFEQNGYLRNIARAKNPDKVRILAHASFLMNAPAAMQTLSHTREITYWSLLRVHETLFKDFFPWAGQDRCVTAPELDIRKGPTEFAQPHLIQRAIEHGLELAQTRGRMATEPGRIMGYFAFAHPFLDGNGRTIMLVHGELCFRAGISIDWSKTNKSRYLSALTQEIADPHAGHLDRYLKDFIGPKIPRAQWRQVIGRLPGLDGELAQPEAEPQATEKRGPGLKP